LLKLTPHTVVEVERLLDVIGQVRRQGWCLVSEELEPGLVSIAAPVTDRSGKVVAAMNIGGQASSTNCASLVENCLPKLLATAARVSGLVRVQQ
jgi:IclR family pca regulon transcriptional regulator